MKSQNGIGSVNTIPGERAIAAWEIASVASSALIAEWILFASTGSSRIAIAIPVTLALAFIIVSQRLHNEGLRDLGVRFDNLFKALTLLAVPMIVVAALVLVIELWLGARPDFQRWHSDRPVALQLAISYGWGFVQQYVLQGFINRRAQIIWGLGGLSVLLTAIVFAVLHFPNPVLMGATFVGGLVWATIFQRAPNLFALALSHAAMSWVMVATLPESWLNHARVGFKYFR